MKMLCAIKSRLRFGQLAGGPELEKRMVLAVALIARGDQLIVETAHKAPPSACLSSNHLINKTPAINSFSAQKRQRRRAHAHADRRCLNSSRTVLTFAALGGILHGSETDIEQGRLAARNRTKSALDRLAHFAGLLDLFTVTVEGLHQLGIFRARRDVQSGKVFRFDRPALRIISRDTRLLRQIALIVKHYREK